MKKKILSIFLAFCLIFSLLPMGAMADETQSGTCGDNLTWTLDDTGLLTISGTGAMEDYSSGSTAPWYNKRTAITSVVIENGVSSIGNGVCFGLANLTNVTLPDSITRISRNAFRNCNEITSC